MRTLRKRLPVLLLLVACSVAVLGLAPEAHAAGYTLTTVPARLQESNTPGVVLFLNVTGAVTGLTYQFTWTVTDPSGMAHNANNQTMATSTSFVLSAAYPSRFGTNINYVGNYTINVQQNNPTPIASAAIGQFQVGLTDNVSYQRTLSVSVRARGYNNNSPVTVNISHAGTSAPGYPAIVTTDSTGNLATVWAIPANVSTGLWTVSLTGNPTKTVPDNQTFNVNPAGLTITKLGIAHQSLARTQLQSFNFTANYPNGMAVRTGSGKINVTEPSVTTSFLLTASYNATLATYRATYQVLPSDQKGPWTAALSSGAVNDGYGNLGPLATVTGGFTVNPANITIAQLNQGQAALIRTQTQTFSFTSKYFNGPTEQTGSAQVRITEPDGTTSFYTTANYDSTLGAFYTAYQIPSNGQVGAWVATIDPYAFNDGYGNLGPSTSVVRAFTVQLANLSVSATIAAQTYTPGQVIPIYARITYPDGSVFTAGNVNATLSSPSTQISTVQLIYVPGQSQWIGTYSVGPKDPSGLWLVTVKTSDSYGNAGQETISAIVNVPPPANTPQPLDLYYFLFAALAIGSGGSSLLVLRRINPTHRGFDDFFKLTGGEIPPGTTLLVLGDPGSGISTLGQELIHHQLIDGKPCGIITYEAFPSEIARSMRSFGWDVSENIKNGSFNILDCYSGLAGAENAPIRDPVDFTEISIQVTSMIDKASPGPITIVLDSITPIFNSAPPRTVVNFLRVLGAKLKNSNGILIIAGSKGSIPDEVRTSLDSMVDGLIELSVIRSGQSIIRTLTVKRLAGRKISLEPAEFEIAPAKGILFKKMRIPLRILTPTRRQTVDR